MAKSGGYPKVEYGYDATGQRVSKLYKPTQYEVDWVYTYYVRDAQGNTLSVYSLNKGTSGGGYADTLKVEEYTLYGSSRLGIHACKDTVSIRTYTGGTVMVGTAYYLYSTGSPTLTTNILGASNRYTFWRGEKKYELSNHLGNVLAVISDRKLQRSGANWGAKKPDFYPEVLSYADYYPFGWEMPGRSSTAGATRYGFNGMEKDLETGWQDFGARMYDGRVSRWFARDPLEAKYPWMTTYGYAANSPLMFVDVDGRELELFYVNQKTGKSVKIGTYDKNGVLTYSRQFQRYMEVRSGQSEWGDKPEIDQFMTGDKIKYEDAYHALELFNQARSYLYESPNGNESDLRNLERSATTVDVKIYTGEVNVDDGSTLSHATGTSITWHANMGIYEGESVTNSPALALEHEATHVKDYIELGKEKYAELHDTPVPEMDNELERRAIEHTNKIAEGLGEGIRKSHHGFVGTAKDSVSQPHLKSESEFKD